MEFILALERTAEGYRVADEHFGEVLNSARPPSTTYRPSGLNPRPKVPNVFPGVIPVSANWFNPQTIHEIERDALPEFFANISTYKTPQTYIEYRNYIMHIYRQDPATYLTSTACRRALVCDACAIVRIHQFLEKWGLINF